MINKDYILSLYKQKLEEICDKDDLKSIRRDLPDEAAVDIFMEEEDIDTNLSENELEDKINPYILSVLEARFFTDW